MPSTGFKFKVAESLNRDHGKGSEFSDLMGMKLNVSKTMIVSRSLTMHPQSLQVTSGATHDLDILGTTFDY